MALRLLVCLSFFYFSSVSHADSSSLQISVGDSLAIAVYNEADLSLKVRVDNSGVVNFPLIGQVPVLNLTPKQLAKNLEERYDDGYLVTPSVTVSIERYRPFYIHGEVKAPGVYEFDQTLTVEQAIAIAGGLSERASSSKWFIARPSENKPLPVNKESPVLPGDIITINSSFF
jgi:polysaccharide biosynthesis/export protein VpsN